MNALGFLGLCCIKRGKTFTKSGEQTQRKHQFYFENLAAFSTKRGGADQKENFSKRGKNVQDGVGQNIALGKWVFQLFHQRKFSGMEWIVHSFFRIIYSNYIIIPGILDTFII